VTRKASMMNWSSPRPCSRKMGIIYDMSSTRWLEPLSQNRSPPQSLFFHMLRWHTPSSTECSPNTISDVLACHLGRSPVSIWWRRTEDFRGIQHTLKVWSGVHHRDWSIFTAE
jgi:hypothetical protein